MDQSQRLSFTCSAMFSGRTPTTAKNKCTRGARRLSTRRNGREDRIRQPFRLFPSECLLHQQQSELPFISTVSFSRVTFFAHFALARCVAQSILSSAETRVHVGSRGAKGNDDRGLNLPVSTGRVAQAEVLASVLEALPWRQEHTHRTRQARLPQKQGA
jgi:hypothetical protein